MPDTDLSTWVLLFALVIFFSLVFLVGLFWFGWRVSQRSRGTSPYTGLPLRRASELSYFYAERVLLFLHSFQQYDNRIFKMEKAAYCRETGRIFQDCVTWYDVIKVDWSFIQKRYPGNYVSWGSLNHAQQEAMRNAHDSLEGYQIEMSSPSPAPRAVEPDYVYIKPGPLYVDLETKILLGWKMVPNTNLEVLIMQKPKN